MPTSTSASAAGPSRRGAACSTPRVCRRRKSSATRPSISPRSRSTARSTGNQEVFSDYISTSYHISSCCLVSFSSGIDEKRGKQPMIRVGVGGWVFAPWRGEFYPKGLPQARELEYASRKLTTIEINGTFYGTQKPESFRKWAGETPDDFVFSLKAPRLATHRRVLAEAGESIERFFASGVLELKEKLGPILWQFHPSKKFEEEDFAAF